MSKLATRSNRLCQNPFSVMATSETVHSPPNMLLAIPMIVVLPESGVPKTVISLMLAIVMDPLFRPFRYLGLMRRNRGARAGAIRESEGLARVEQMCRCLA